MFASLLLIIASSLADLTNVNVKINYFVENDRFKHVRSNTPGVTCNCSILRNRNIGDLKDAMGITLIDTTVSVLQENDVADLPNLRELDLSSASIERLSPGFLGDLPELKYLYLEDNRLVELTRGVFNCPHVLHLSLKRNRIDGIEAETFANTSSLLELDLSENRIGKIQNWFGEDNSLETLRLSRNKLLEIPNFAFRRMRKVKYLYLAYNNITALYSDSFVGLSNLFQLDLRYNNIQHINNEVFRCQSGVLKLLNLDGNILENNSISKLNLFSRSPEVKSVFVTRRPFGRGIDSRAFKFG